MKIVKTLVAASLLGMMVVVTACQSGGGGTATEGTTAPAETPATGGTAP
ncbi:MAG: hypothetical protein QOD06_3402 [Candidatus Binatota bacterium]|nr:hypothetical protein [Candidatus Binatota bacterium]